MLQCILKANIYCFTILIYCFDDQKSSVSLLCVSLCPLIAKTWEIYLTITKIIVGVGGRQG